MACLAGMMLGLFVSALAPNAVAAPLILLLVVLPHLVLNGGLVAVSDFHQHPDFYPLDRAGP